MTAAEASRAAAIRPAVLADAQALTAFHVRCWRDTYGALAPQEAYAQLTEARRRPYWDTVLADPEVRQKTFLAVQAGQIAGFCSFGLSANPLLSGAGEIKHLFVDPMRKRTGLGLQFMRLAARHMEESGCTRFGLAVVRGNEQALAFYAAMGGAVVGRFTDAGRLWRSDNLLVVWDLPFTR